MIINDDHSDDVGDEVSTCIPLQSMVAGVLGRLALVTQSAAAV